MNFKTTIVMFALLVVAVVIFLVVGTGNKTDDTGSTANTNLVNGQRLLNIQSSQVSRLTITPAKGQRTTLDKVDGKWQLLEPVKAPAVDWSAHDLVDSIVTARSVGQPSDDPGASAGLDKPRYRVEMILTDGKTQKLDIGDTTGAGDMMYVRANDGGINLVSSDLDRTLKSAAQNLRDKHLFTLHGTDVKQFRLDYATTQMALQLVNGKWQVIQPEKFLGDIQAIPPFLTSIEGIEATEFVKADAPELVMAGFDHPTLKLWLSDQAPASSAATTLPASPAGGIALTVGSADSLAKEHYFVQLSNGQYAKISKDTLTLLQKSPLDFRDRDIVSIPPGQVTRVSILKETFPVPATRPATGPTTLAATLASATLPTGAATMPLAADVLAPPAATQPVSSHLVVLVKRKIEPLAALGPPMPLATQPTTMASATQPSATTLASAATQAATAPSTQPEIQSAWQLLYDPKAQVDDGRVVNLLSRFSPLRADKWLEKAPTSPPLERYTVEVTAEPGGGNPAVLYQFQIAKPADAATWAATYNSMNFQISADLLDVLDTDYHQGAAPPPQAQKPMPMGGMGGLGGF